MASGKEGNVAAFVEPKGMPAVIMGAFVAADAKVFNLLLGHVYIFF
jgi:hypothetical protein